MPGFAWVLRMEIQTLMLAWQSLSSLTHLSLSTLDSVMTAEKMGVCKRHSHSKEISLVFKKIRGGT